MAEMQHHRAAPSRRTPSPDGVRPLPSPSSATRYPPQVPPLPAAPEFSIIGLFALRLAKRLIQGLERYPGRDDDIAWLTNFVAAYPFEFSLAKISGARKNDYVAVYGDIISRMKRQPRYPMRFMQLNPDRSMQQRLQGCNEEDREHRERMTDLERLDIIDFSDAASEWGSTVPIPAREADRMIDLVHQRRIADLDVRRPPRDDGHMENRHPPRDDRHVHFEERRR